MSMTRSPATPISAPATKATATSSTAVRRALLVEGVGVSIDGDLDRIGTHGRLQCCGLLLLRALVPLHAEGGHDRESGQRYGDRAEPARQELHRGGRGGDALAHSRAEPRQCRVVRLVAERVRVFAKAIEEVVFTHTSPPVSPSTCRAPATDANAPS